MIACSRPHRRPSRRTNHLTAWCLEPSQGLAFSSPPNSGLNRVSDSANVSFCSERTRARRNNSTPRSIACGRFRWGASPEGLRGSSDSDLAPRSGDARDSGGGAAALGVDRHPVVLGGLRASRPQVAAVCVLEAVQGRQVPAAGALAAHHEVSQAKTVRLIAAYPVD